MKLYSETPRSAKMSQPGNPANSSSSNSSIPVSEAYWSLVDKADRKFSKIRDLPYYERNRYCPLFNLVFSESIVWFIGEIM